VPSAADHQRIPSNVAPTLAVLEHFNRLSAATVPGEKSSHQ